MAREGISPWIMACLVSTIPGGSFKSLAERSMDCWTVTPEVEVEVEVVVWAVVVVVVVMVVRRSMLFRVSQKPVTKLGGVRGIWVG